MIDFKEFIEKQRWIFAKTYATRAPHEYIVRRKANCTDEEFMSAVDYILKNGMTMHYYGHPNKYVYLEGRVYWMMTGADGQPLVINRSNVDEYIYSIKWKGLKKEE